MGAYLSGRGVADRAHVVLRESRERRRRVRLRQGHRRRDHDGALPVGRATRVADGLIASYQVTFDLEHVLVEDDS